MQSQLKVITVILISGQVACDITIPSGNEKWALTVDGSPALGKTTLEIEEKGLFDYANSYDGMLRYEGHTIYLNGLRSENSVEMWERDKFENTSTNCHYLCFTIDSTETSFSGLLEIAVHTCGHGNNLYVIKGTNDSRRQSDNRPSAVPVSPRSKCTDTRMIYEQ